MNSLKHGCSLYYYFSPEALIDILTIVPLLYQSQHRIWLSFAFLRSFQIATSYMRLEKLGGFNR
eukprot:995245-Pyramimonas_sp.AAC.1